jgi:S1-C subfamily serine protease
MDALTTMVDSQHNLVPRLGILGLDLNDQLRSVVSDLRDPSGVIVVARAAELISPETGLKTGDVVHSLNGHPIQSVEELRVATRQLRPGDAVALQVERDGGYLYLAFEME